MQDTIQRLNRALEGRYRVERESLRERPARGGELTIDEAVRILEQISDASAAALEEPPVRVSG